MPGLVMLAGLLQLAAPRTVAARAVEIPTGDGVHLAATYYRPDTAGPAVVFFRNCDQSRAGVDAYARVLAARGMHAIAYDYRSGLASGRDWRTTRAGDADRVFAWLAAQPGVDSTRLGVIGGSCGVSLALDFFSRHLTTRGLVILSGPSDSSHRALVSRTPSLAVLGAASVEEGAAVGSIDGVVRASRHAASRMFALRGAGHGTDILRHPPFADTALSWLQARLGPERR